MISSSIKKGQHSIRIGDRFRGIMVLFALCLVLMSCEKKEEEPVSIIPAPVLLERKEGRFVINQHTSIGYKNERARKVAGYLSEMISAASVFQIPMNEVNGLAKKNIIFIDLVEGDSVDGSYNVTGTPDHVIIQSSSPVGLFYGVQTLRQMLTKQIEEKNKTAESWTIPAVSIKDAPAYSWRGMHLDVSRHFFSVDFVKKFIDRLALYKFNRLHLHLTDDQGWRLQINKYPQLTEEGAWRILNNQDSVCLKRAVTNSDFVLPEEFFREKEGVKQYGGYYSQEDIREIVKYAEENFVTIVPEIDMPGHMNAAIALFPDLTCVDKGGWGKLFSIPLCPCEETTYQFIDDVIAEVAQLFPGEYIHIGADEVDEHTWTASSSCQELMKKKGVEPKALHSYFVNRVNAIVQRYSKKTIGWDEILDGTVDSSITVMYWRGWVPEAPVHAVQSGHDLIMSPTSCCYFDYAPDATTLEKLYSFDPVPKGMEANDRQRLLGVQANIWTEYIPTPARLDYMTMPRMVALAEIAWSPSRNWNDFVARVTEHYQRWDAMNIKYRLPDIPNIREHVVFIDKAILELDIPTGINEVRYTADGTEPSENSTKYEHPLTVDSTVTFRLLTVGNGGRPGNRYVVRFEKQDYRKPVSAKDTVSGLMCRYFEAPYNSVEVIDIRDLKREVVVHRVEIPSFCRPSVFALQLDGLLQVPEDGIYTFYLSSDDGSTLQIGDRLVVDNNGYHGDREMAGQVALAKGDHPIKIKYFDGGGGNSLGLKYEGPSIEKQEIPQRSFRLK